MIKWWRAGATLVGAMLVAGCGPETPRADEPKPPTVDVGAPSTASATATSATATSATATAEPAPSPSVLEARKKWHCTPWEGFDAKSCKDPCNVGPPLICRGVEVGREQRAREAKAYEAGIATCQCICPEDQRRCSQVP